MNKKILYCVLFAIPGFFVSLLASIFFFGVVYGFFWIYYFGDNPWPKTGEVLSVFFILVFLAVWTIFIIFGYLTGRRTERDPGSTGKHILVSTGVTFAAILLIIIHQVNVGNIGAKSEGIRCSDFCRQQGYSMSGIPAKNAGERSCSCYDISGREVIKLPMDNVNSNQ